jgi:cell division transport system permease protein
MAAKQRLGSYPSFLIIVSLSIALFIAGFCGWMAVSSKSLIKSMKQKVEVQAYLDQDIEPTKVDSIFNVLTAKQYTLKENGKAKVEFISKDKAAEQFKEDTNEDYSVITNENPFRDALSIKIDEKFFTENNLKIIKSDLEQIDGVFEADFAKNFIETINENFQKISYVLIGFVVLMLLGIIFLVNNTIRLALFSQRFIIRSMQLVGATDAFIKKPFLKRGVVLGLISGLIAVVVLFGIRQLSISQIEGFMMTQNWTDFGILSAGILLIGCIMGILSTSIALNKYLEMDIADFY